MTTNMKKILNSLVIKKFTLKKTGISFSSQSNLVAEYGRGWEVLLNWSVGINIGIMPLEAQSLSKYKMCVSLVSVTEFLGIHSADTL